MEACGARTHTEHLKYRFPVGLAGVKHIGIRMGNDVGSIAI